MKVLHIGHAPLPQGHPDFHRIRSHPGRWVVNLALAQKTHAQIAPELLVQVPGASQDYDASIEGIPVHFIKAPDRFRAATLFYFDTRRLAAAARAFAPDVLHAHGTEDAYALAAQRAGLPYVITAQGLHFLISRHIKPGPLSRDGIVQAFERRSLARARDVIAKSQYVAEALAGEFPHLRIHQIPNTIDPRLLEISAAKKPNTIAFVGTIVPRKGVDLICAALELVVGQIPEIELWVFGDDSRSTAQYDREIKAQLRHLLDDRLVLHGILPNLEVAGRVAQAAALVAPSREEMFGNQAVEALAVGTRAIVTEHTAMAENMRRFRGGVVVPQENPSALAGAIIDASRNPEVGDTSEVRNRIVEYMGPAKVASQHEALYGEILAEWNR